ncbi:hypothetical protein GCM10010121_095440 [Streptomyces brasiliensis]|uniref:Protein kinase domain-containing protein n=1 Tax=Streptomyces brasiliensis TaxID=1954 RepID=A0A917UN27_9ACTN|nr:hypothetical protein GCM10010121_095440 [Streptomyces brasiliensis]
MSSLYVGAIEECWGNEGFARSDVVPPRQGGVRQQTFNAFEASVDWGREDHVRRALLVFESMLRRLDRESRKHGGEGLESVALEELRETFDRDGYQLDDQLRVHRVPRAASPETQKGTVPRDARHITQVTRRRLVRQLNDSLVTWYGDLDEITFLRRLYDLESLPSEDSRFDNAEEDIFKHRYTNEDWDEDWIFTDARFGLRDGTDEILLRFLAEMLHPEVRSDDAQVAFIAMQINQAVSRDGYALMPIADISGYPVYGARVLAEDDKATPDAAAHPPSITDSNSVAAQTLARLSELPDADHGARIAAASRLAPLGTANPHPGAAAVMTNGPEEPAADENTRAGNLPAPKGEYAAVQGAARGHRKDYAMDRGRMAEGGQADIFAATHKATGVRVALKRRRSHRETPAARMRREIDVAQDLNAHPHYVPILDTNPSEGWLVMPMAQGTAEDHRDLFQSPAALLDLVHALIDVLDAAHTHGWVHRDVRSWTATGASHRSAGANCPPSSASTSWRAPCGPFDSSAPTGPAPPRPTRGTAASVTAPSAWPRRSSSRPSTTSCRASTTRTPTRPPSSPSCTTASPRSCS